jgi:hypothetical protein
VVSLQFSRRWDAGSDTAHESDFDHGDDLFSMPSAIELRFFADDTALVRALWDVRSDRAAGPFDVLTKWGWRRRAVSQWLMPVPPKEAQEVCGRYGSLPDTPAAD